MRVSWVAKWHSTHSNAPVWLGGQTTAREEEKKSLAIAE